MPSTSENQLPDPHPDFAGRNNLDATGRNSFHRKSKLWQFDNTNLEQNVATCARYTLRLIDRLTGRAYTADELLAAGGGAPISLTTPPVNGSVPPTSIAAAVVDWSNEASQKVFSGNTTFTFANVVTGGYTLIYLTQPTGTGWGANWPSGITWASGPPSTPASNTTTLVRLYATSGSTFNGSFTTGVTVPATTAGTPGMLGQLAIVSTKNESGFFRDAWVCVRTSPMTWNPPGTITRAPNGTYHRHITDNDGNSSIELAYP